MFIAKLHGLMYCLCVLCKNTLLNSSKLSLIKVIHHAIMLGFSHFQNVLYVWFQWLTFEISQYKYRIILVAVIQKSYIYWLQMKTKLYEKILVYTLYPKDSKKLLWIGFQCQNLYQETQDILKPSQNIFKIVLLYFPCVDSRYIAYVEVSLISGCVL